MVYCFYIIYSNSIKKYYTGHTANPEERLIKHNTNHKGFTGKANDWKLVYSEPFISKEDAYKRERQVKSWKSKRLLLKLIQEGSEHPD